MGYLLGVSHATSPRVTVIDDSWAVLSGTPILEGTGFSLAFSPNGHYLAIGHVNSPHLTILNTSDWSTVSGTPTLADTGRGVAFSPDGAYLAIGHAGSPHLTILNTSDWSTVSGTPTLAGTGYGVAFSPDGAYLAVGHSVSPFLRILNTSDWSTVSGTPTLAGIGYSVAFSHDGNYLAIAHDTTPFLRILNTSDWSTVSGTPTLAGTGNWVNFSPNDNYLAIAHGTTPFLRILNTSDWSTVSGTPTLASTGRGVAFSPDGAYLATTHSTSPFLTIVDTSDWSTVSGTPTLAGTSYNAAFLEIPEINLIGEATISVDVNGILGTPLYGVASVSLSATGNFSPRGVIVDPPILGQQSIFRVYLTATGHSALELPARSFQARNRLTTRNYLAVVVPDPLPYIDAIQERSSGRLVVKTGFALADGTEVLEEIASGVFSDFRYDLGPFNGSATLVGYDYRTPGAPLTRTMRGISFRGMNNSGARRFRCDLDMYLKPGDTADLGDDESIVVDQISYTVSARQAVMEISEAEPSG